MGLPLLTTDQVVQIAQLVKNLAERNHLPDYQPPIQTVHHPLQQQFIGPPLAGDQPPPFIHPIRDSSGPSKISNNDPTVAQMQMPIYEWPRPGNIQQ